MVTALIIDDHPENIEMLEAYLNLYKIKAISTTSGRVAFAMAQDVAPDIIFSDLLMPETTWDGYVTCGKFRTHPLTAHIPIVAVTGAGNEKKAYEAGYDYFLMRPFQTGVLRKILNDMRLLPL
ncbi:MAG: hypothetical protein Phog2KO_49750 [Phototrophicaceae bacterium]